MPFSPLDQILTSLRADSRAATDGGAQPASAGGATFKAHLHRPPDRSHDVDDAADVSNARPADVEEGRENHVDADNEKGASANETRETNSPSGSNPEEQQKSPQSGSTHQDEENGHAIEHSTETAATEITLGDVSIKSAELISESPAAHPEVNHGSEGATAVPDRVTTRLQGGTTTNGLEPTVESSSSGETVRLDRGAEAPLENHLPVTRHAQVAEQPTQATQKQSAAAHHQKEKVVSLREQVTETKPRLKEKAVSYGEQVTETKPQLDVSGRIEMSRLMRSSDDSVQPSSRTNDASAVGPDNQGTEHRAPQTTSSHTTPWANTAPTLSRPLLDMIGMSSERAGDRLALGGTDQARLLQRVARAIEVAQNRDGPIRLRLSPPELGSLRLEVRVNAGVLSARIEVETEIARTVLLENISALRDRLADQGVRVEQFDVDLMQRQGQAAPDGPSDQGEQSAGKANQEPDELREEEVEPTRQSAGRVSGDSEQLDVVI